MKPYLGLLFGLFCSQGIAAPIGPLTVRQPHSGLVPQLSYDYILDNAILAVDELKYANLKEMELNDLLKGSVQNEGQKWGWSGYYWPTLSGGLANRYLDQKYRPGDDFSINKNYLTLNLVNTETLSPVQKYDRAVGDINYTLTKMVLKEGQDLLDKYGLIEPWNGICNGWSAASLMVPRPSKSVTIISPSGEPITFNPTDIKALASLLWAKGHKKVIGTGTRCEMSRPPRTINFTQRALHPECMDTNPGTFHLALVNQLGVSKRGLIMDRSQNEEVWNQPLMSYQYKYFNPKLGPQGLTAHIKSAIVNLKDFKFPQDQFGRQRAWNAFYLVGVQMTATYAVETQPSDQEFDVSQNDQFNTETWLYDLELDANGNIVGGEWHQDAHPDFLWIPEKDSSAVSGFEALTEKKGLTFAAKMASAEGIPLANFVKQLVDLSQ